MTVLGMLLWVLAATPAETPEAMKQRATALYQQEKFDEACALFAKAARALPEDGANWSDLAACELRRKRPQAATDAALKAVKFGDVQARKNAYFTLWKLGMRIRLPPTKVVNKDSDGEQSESAIVPVQGPGVLQCPQPIHLRYSELDEEDARSSHGYTNTVHLFPAGVQPSEAAKVHEIEVHSDSFSVPNPCVPPVVRDEMLLSLLRHPAIQATVRECHQANNDSELGCLQEWSLGRMVEVLRNPQGNDAFGRRMRRCGAPLGKEPSWERVPCGYADSPRCAKYRACLDEVASASLAKGTEAFDAEQSVWLLATVSACQASLVRSHGCELIVADPCCGRVGYRCSDESIRELQFPAP